MSRALLLIDIQNDFLPGGPLAVPGGDEVVPIAESVAKQFDFVVATQDWHPPDHASFAANHPGKEPGDQVDVQGVEQILWPTHCVQGTTGANFALGFPTEAVRHTVQKGTDRWLDSYSGFYDNDHRHSTGLKELLSDHAIKEVFLLGLATDYCVKFSALDACRLGFQTHVLLDGCRAVNLKAGDEQAAVQEMEAAGVIITSSRQL